MDFMAAAVRTSPAVEVRTTEAIMDAAARGPVIVSPMVAEVGRGADRDGW